MSNDSIPHQGELELPFPEMVRDVPLLPARMINEFCYCPRLAYLQSDSILTSGSIINHATVALPWHWI